MLCEPSALNEKKIEDNKGNFFIKVFFPIFSAFYFEDKGSILRGVTKIFTSSPARITSNNYFLERVKCFIVRLKL